MNRDRVRRTAPRSGGAAGAVAISAIAAIAACDELTVGRETPEAGPPRLVRIMVQDEDVYEGRQLATDLLRDLPKRTCSDRNPCEAGEKPCVIPEGQSEGTCPDPLNVRNTPPAIGLLIFGSPYGGNQIRLVFDRGLQPGTDTLLQTLQGEEALVALLRPDGTEVAAHKYYDPAGSPFFTSDVFQVPYGPAIVLKPYEPFSVATRYTIRLRPAMLKSREGLPLSSDVSGRIRSSYDMVTEGLYVLAEESVPDLAAQEPAPIPPNRRVLLRTNADVDEETATATTVVVRDMAGARVPVRAFWSRGDDPEACPDNVDHRSLEIVRTSSSGRAIPWSDGTYLLTIRGVLDLDTHQTALASDVASTGEVNGTFVVSAPSSDAEEDDLAIEHLVLPEDCSKAERPDAGAPPADAAETPDSGGDLPADGGVAVDGGVSEDAGSPDATTDGGLSPDLPIADTGTSSTADAGAGDRGE